MDRTKLALVICSLLLLAGFLRFTNLGYSEFQDDEKKALIKHGQYDSPITFLLNQRKGPMQFAVTSAVLAFNNDRQNEFGLRLPFTIANLLAVVVFFLLLRELIESKLAAYVGALMFLANGFIVGFSRIAQYQNLNILFSLLALLFFVKLSKTTKHFYLFALLGVASFALSLLSHWDAIFVLVPIVYFYTQFLRRTDVDKQTKLKVSVAGFGVACLLLLPFLIPYVKVQLSNQANVTYFERRVGLSTYPLQLHKYIFDLYNPFVTLYLLAALAALSLVKIKKTWIYVLWFVINFLTIRYFMQKPGTHIYNYVIPAIVLATLGFAYLRKFLAIPVLLACAFLYWQSYMLFVDHKIEYPWQAKPVVNSKYLKLIAPVYNSDEVLTFGFPHYRSWKHVAEIVLTDPAGCMYITNEGKEISQAYLPDNYGKPPKPKCYYVAEVVRPFIAEGNDAKFAETTGKKPVYTYEQNGEKLLKLYKIR